MIIDDEGHTVYGNYGFDLDDADDVSSMMTTGLALSSLLILHSRHIIHRLRAPTDQPANLQQEHLQPTPSPR